VGFSVAESPGFPKWHLPVVDELAELIDRLSDPVASFRFSEAAIRDEIA